MRFARRVVVVSVAELVVLSCVLALGPVRSARSAQPGPAKAQLVELAGPPAATAAIPAPGTEFKDCKKCPVMVVVPAGQFVMGSLLGEIGRNDDEGPPHGVTIAKPFAVGKFDVTFDEWEACVADRECRELDDSGFGRGRRPVINVTYDEAEGYTKWLSEKTGKKYRLLTEAEWEYAARAGTVTARFWGNSQERACEFANVANPATKQKYSSVLTWEIFECDDGYVETAPVGSFKPNAFGLYDMLGNVSQWVQDCWNGSYQGAPTDGSAWLTGDCSRRVIRGGGWGDGPPSVRSAARDGVAPSIRGKALGFRVARTLP